MDQGGPVARAPKELLRALRRANTHQNKTRENTNTIATILGCLQGYFYSSKGILFKTGLGPCKICGSEVFKHSLNFQTPVGVSNSQLAKFRLLSEKTKDDDLKKLVDNFRPGQKMNSREVLDVDTSTKIFQITSFTNSGHVIIFNNLLMFSLLAYNFLSFFLSF